MDMNTTNLNIDRTAIVAAIFAGEDFTKFNELKDKVDNFNATFTEEQEFIRMRQRVTVAIKEKEKEPKLAAMKQMAGDFTAMEVLNILKPTKKECMAYLKALAPNQEVVISRVVIGKAADGKEEIFEYVNGKRYGGRGEGAVKMAKFKKAGYEAFVKGLTEEGKVFMNALTPRGLKKNEEKMKAMFATSTVAKPAVAAKGKK